MATNAITISSRLEAARFEPDDYKRKHNTRVRFDDDPAENIDIISTIILSTILLSTHLIIMTPRTMVIWRIVLMMKNLLRTMFLLSTIILSTILLSTHKA